MRRFDRLRKMARELVTQRGHELGFFKQTTRLVDRNTSVYVMGPVVTTGSTITLSSIGNTSATWTYSATAATAATTATTTIILPQPHAVGRVSSPDKWFASYCVHCGAACWLSETINPHDPAGFLDQGVNDAVYVAQKMNTAAAAAGHKLPFPKRARGIVIFGEVFGEPCKSNPKLLLYYAAI